MEGPPDGSTSPSADEIVYDAKPLRTLTPMFPTPFGFTSFTPPGAHPFVCLTPFGSFASDTPYPPGFTPLYPMFPAFPSSQPTDQRPGGAAPMGAGDGSSNVGEDSKGKGCLRAESLVHGNQTTGMNVSPLNTVNERLLATPNSTSGRKTKKPPHLRVCDVDSSGGQITERKVAPRRKRSKKAPEDILLLPSSSHDAREFVEMVLMKFDAVRRRLTQLDEVKNLGLSRHPGMKAGSVMMNKDLRANTFKRIGHVPGIEIGDLFYFRIEMCLVGLHSPSIAGIDYMTVKFDSEEDPVALSVVSSGGYENQDDDVDVLIYSGQGGGGGSNKSDKKQVDDQKLERGNLALERSLHRGNEIRVIRSERDFQNGKIYIYDGLYKISESWVEKGKSGFNIFKYKLLREAGQPDGIAVWKMTRRWKEDPSTRGEVILPDMSSGIESIPVCLVNDVDNEKGPSHFVYVTQVNYLSPLSSMKPLQGCMCNNICMPGDANCSCVHKNGGVLPYASNGLLVSRKPLIYECSNLCQCSVNCQNRVTQKGIKLHFEVFRTRDRGWGLRSWDPIRAGTFICEYVGEVIDKIKVEEDDENDDYVFHSMYADNKCYRWNNGPELEEPTYVESVKPLPVIITAKRMGNMARFMNHSCSPNVFWQPVQYDHEDEGYPHIMFFAYKHIPPMTELTYDYGMRSAEIGTEEMECATNSQSLKKCLCGSPKCRGFFR